MTGAAGKLLALAGRRNLVLLAALSLVGAVSEGFGIVLLIPLLAGFLGEGIGQGLPGWLVDLPLAVLLTGFVLLVALRAVVEIARALIAQRLEVAVVDTLRHRAVKALFAAEWRFLATQSQSHARSLIVTSIDRIGEGMGHLTALARAGLTLLALLVAGLALSPLLTATIAAFAIVGLAALRWARRDARQLGEDLNQHFETIYRRLEERLSAVRLVKSFGSQDQETQAIAEGFDRMRQTERAYIFGTTLARAIVQIGAALVLAVIVWVGVEQAGLSPVLLLAFVALAVRCVPLIEGVQGSAQGWSHAAPALERVMAMIATAEANEEPLPAQPIIRARPGFDRSLALRDVSYDHPGREQVLSEVSMKLPARTLVGLTGPSGAGKSTIADLLAGLLVPKHGQILLDDVPLGDEERLAWRARVAYVQQDALLFSGTVRENLLWASPAATRSELDRALDAAAAGFVHDLPDGLDCAIGERGIALSGGERQRLALARALLRDPALLILDEPTSAIDIDTEARIAAAVHEIAQRCTVLVIGHRDRLAETAPVRFRIENGRVGGG